ncbi:ADP-ribosylglycohydrolase family protein [Microbacterium sp. ZW T5_56]|uniref:ADP-ribosylglycohydrolase family protein n=1 Tax=Microbacterium sp. ZW T5_56 TaxID=3378081 RepID=UPI003853CE47
MTTALDRARGALTGLALGDALGMPTQDLSRSVILADYGEIHELRAAAPRQLIAAGLPAGTITDDTEQALLLADLLIDAAGTIDIHRFAEALLSWEQRMLAAGSLDLLGPSTKLALSRLQAGEDPAVTGTRGATNGAAMRVTPVGIAFAPEPRGRLLDAVRASALVTHNTSIGLASAAAVAGAVSAGIEGADTHAAALFGAGLADEAEARAPWIDGARVGPRIRWATDLLRDASPTDATRLCIDLIGTSVAAQESVVAALALAASGLEPWRALGVAASVGGDTDTIGAIAGAVLGAAHGMQAWPTDSVSLVTRVNDLDLTSPASGLLALRVSPSA